MLMMFYEASAVFYEIYEVFETCDGRTCASARARRAPARVAGADLVVCLPYCLASWKLLGIGVPRMCDCEAVG